MTLYRHLNYGPIGRIDKANHILLGVSVAQPVEALGWKFLLDGRTIEQLVLLINAAPNGIKSRFTHPGLSEHGLGKFLGRMKNGRVDALGNAIADLHLSKTAASSPAGNLRDYVIDLAEEDPEAFGVSVVIQTDTVWVLDDGTEIEAEGTRPDNATTEYPVARVQDLRAADLVDQPAANRNGIFAFADFDQQTTNPLAEKIFAQLDALIKQHSIPETAVPELVNQFFGEPTQPRPQLAALSATANALINQNNVSDQKARAFAARYALARQHSHQSAVTRPKNQGGIMPTEIKEAQKERAPADAPETPDTAVSHVPDPNDWVTAHMQAVVDAKLSATDLPKLTKQRLGRASYNSPEAIDAAIEEAKQEVATLTADDVIDLPGRPPRSQIHGMTNGREEFERAFEALLSGKRPPNDVRPLSGIREAYLLLTGDYNMTGMFRPENVQLAAVNSTTMAGMVANAMNKRVINLFQEYPMWWAPAVTEEDFATLQDARWITLGGVGELPTVSEGAAYTEMDWDDQTETDSFVKKGGYLGITLEAIDKDDTRRLQAAPRALAQAAWLTLGKSISAIFTSNSGTGPTMSDSNNLFDNSNHSNLGSSAFSGAAIRATKIAMMKQTELNSGERLGALTAPYYYWVPVDLEDTAVVELASAKEPGVADNDINPYAEGDARQARLARARSRIITVPFWTDTDNWAAQANPMLYPSIGLGYRYGRTPEIFSVASPTAGLMFTNDTMPVKVRFFYAVGPTDWRGLYKHNVS